MEHYIHLFTDWFLHLDQKLEFLINTYQGWIYLILFLVIFVETGLVIMPFLPGDSLLFAAGAFCALGSMNIIYVILLLFIAAFLGDTVNYLIGSYLGPKVFKRDYMLIKRSHLQHTTDFFEKHGPKTIIIARFIPIVRTFAPFVAGIGKMNYGKFLSFNVIGGALWVVSITLAGFFLGNMPFVKKNFEFVVLGIIVVSIMPPIIEFLKSRFARKTTV
jgi:membrane-associated protein